MNGPATEAIVQALGWTLIHFIWQATAIGVAFWCFSQVARKASPSVRYLAGCTALSLLCVGALSTFLWHLNASDFLDPASTKSASLGTANKETISFLSHISGLLDIDKDKFRSMAQKLLPVSTQETSNVEFLLGITSQMSSEAIRQRLNDEYQKWNARVTHPDQAIQNQAEQMLQLIAEARSKYVEQNCSSGA